MRLSKTLWTAGAVVGASACLAPAASAVAPIQTEVFVTGLNRPLEMVQHPTDPDVQFVVQQGGVIRVVENGNLGGVFLDVTSFIGNSSGERGLLGLAFPADYPDDPSFYINHTDTAGDTNIVRYQHTPGDPLTGDPSTREVILEVDQPFSNHNGGHLEMGPDGFLYIALGDGGFANDPQQNAQNLNNLLGAILRIDVSGGPGSGFSIPPDNPFVGKAGRDEIWSYGLRNPWKFTFDTGSCGTNAMPIGDVGQDVAEEIDYEPADTPGRNYGWDCMEAFQCAPAPNGCTCNAPGLTLPIHDVPQPTAQSITGGYVYRGQLVPENRGRYFFGDFLTGRVWSLGLSIDQDGEAMVTDVVEHSSELLGGPFQANISSFARDADGELYILGWSSGVIRKIINVNSPANINDDAAVDGADLGLLLGQWGATGCGEADLNNDDIVDGADLGLLLGQWGNQ